MTGLTQKFFDFFMLRRLESVFQDIILLMPLILRSLLLFMRQIRKFARKTAKFKHLFLLVMQNNFVEELYNLEGINE